MNRPPAYPAIQKTESRRGSSGERQRHRPDPAERERVGAAVRQLEREGARRRRRSGLERHLEAEAWVGVEMARPERGPGRERHRRLRMVADRATRARLASGRVRRLGRSPPSPGPPRTAPRRDAASRPARGDRPASRRPASSRADRPPRSGSLAPQRTEEDGRPMTMRITGQNWLQRIVGRSIPSVRSTKNQSADAQDEQADDQRPEPSAVPAVASSIPPGRRGRRRGSGREGGFGRRSGRRRRERRSGSRRRGCGQRFGGRRRWHRPGPLGRVQRRGRHAGRRVRCLVVHGIPRSGIGRLRGVRAIVDPSA